MSSGSSGAASYERSVSESERASGDRATGKLSDKLRALSLDLDKQPQSQLTGKFYGENFFKLVVICVCDTVRYGKSKSF